AEQPHLAQLREEALGVGVVLLVLRGDRIEQLVRHGAGHLDEVVRLVGGEKSVDGHGSSGVWSALPPLCSRGRRREQNRAAGAGGCRRSTAVGPPGSGERYLRCAGVVVVVSGTARRGRRGVPDGGWHARAAWDKMRG